MIDSGTEALHLFREIPGELREVLKNVDHALSRLDVITARIAQAIVLASLGLWLLTSIFRIGSGTKND